MATNNEQRQRVLTEVDGLAPARGITLGVILGAAIWCGIGLLLWLLL
jgi:hypothetical protein